MVTKALIGNLSSIAGNYTDDVLRSVSGIFQNVPGFSTLIKIFQVIGILFIIYLIFMIIRVFAGWKSARNLSRIVKTVEEINKKLDILTSKVNVNKKEKKR